MDLTLSKKADYVLRAAIALGHAWDSNELRKVRELAEEMALPRQYTPQILGILVKAGLAESRAGQTGGYRLVKAPQEITVLQLIELGEGPLWPQRCTLDGGPCRWDRMCAVHPAWEQAYDALASSLRKVSLASLVAVDEKLEAGVSFPVNLTHPIPTERLPSEPATKSRSPNSRSGRRTPGTAALLK